MASRYKKPAEGSFWDDLKDACPVISVPMLSGGICLIAILVTYSRLKPLRVNNGSLDSCDPLLTYGEITPVGMHSLLGSVGKHSGSRFLDIGSGHGLLTLWAATAAPEGGGFSESVGVELRLDRHKEAMKALAESPPAVRERVSLIHGDFLQHQTLFNNVSVVYYNNLCFPRDTSERIAKAFRKNAPSGSIFVALAEVPSIEARDTETVDDNKKDDPENFPRSLSMRRSDVSILMNWREEGYKPFIYTKL
eukprot:TRINITY_DN7130_c2_g3_i1.p1 TRINITY_DN7130_c2_g3~~TRINITY_DN7130_c2_g3_i1.p1  ORF type:complete len:250 (+),score=20.92 TRINITY_DN7130_c2_g3_i1:43-792(+)